MGGSSKRNCKTLIKSHQMLNAWIKAVENCSSFNSGNSLSDMLPYIKKLSSPQVSRLITAYNDNSELRGSFGFNGKNARFYGDGLPYHLSRVTGKTYRLAQFGRIELV